MDPMIINGWIGLRFVFLNLNFLAECIKSNLHVVRVCLMCYVSNSILRLLMR